MATTIQPSTSTRTRTSRDQTATEASKKIKSVKLVKKKFKMALYGRNKVGKTKFACSSGLKTLVIDCNEKGYDSITEYPNVDIYELAKWEELDPIYWHLRHGKHDYEVIVIDTMTTLAGVGMKWVLKDDAERDMNRDPMTPDRRSYLKLNEMMKDVIYKFRNLPYHIIFNVQEKTSANEDDEGNTLVEVHPELSPGPRSALLSATNIIGRIYVKEVEVKGKTKMERRMLLGAFPRFVSGNRFKQLKAIERIPPEGGLANFIERVYGGTDA